MVPGPLFGVHETSAAAAGVAIPKMLASMATISTTPSILKYFVFIDL
jgi:hypothetical protein